MNVYLGIDIGTFETKGVLVDGEGRVVAAANRAHQMAVPRPGWAEHNAERDWWGDVCSVSQRLLAEGPIDPRSIRAVGISAIGPCVLPVDQDNRPLTSAILYGVDTRATAEIAALHAAIGGDAILEMGGNALTSQSVGPKILWLRKNRPELWAKTARIHTSTSFVVERLTGRAAIDYYSAANTCPLYDVEALAYTTRLTSEICDLGFLPEPCWTTDVVGGVVPEAAEATGLFPGTPVICGTIDAAAEALSVGMSAPGDAMMMYGSTVFIIALTDRRLRDPRLWYAPWLFPGEHAAMAGLATSGTLTHWFRDQFAHELTFDDAFARLAAEAESSVPGANGLVILPYFSGERTPIHDPGARGAILGLDLTHTRGDLYRALIEGIAHGTRHVFDTYAETDQQPKRLLAVGGGTKNRLWVETTSDVTGLDQEVCQVTAGASYGDAFLAAVGIGDARREDIHAWNPVARRIKARGDPVHERRHEVFLRFYEQTRDLMHLLAGDSR